MLLTNVVGEFSGQTLAVLWAFERGRASRTPERRRIRASESEVGNLATGHVYTLINGRPARSQGKYQSMSSALAAGMAGET